MTTFFSSLILANLSLRLIGLSGLEGFRDEYSFRRADYWRAKAAAAPRCSFQKINYYEKAIEIRPDLIEAHLSLGETYYDLGLAYGHRDLYDNSLQSFQNALRIDKNLVFAHYRIGTIYFLRGEFKSCRRELEAARKIDPSFQPAENSLRMLEENIREMSSQPSSNSNR